MTDQHARQELIRLSLSLFQRGYATGSSGNISVLLHDNTLLTTPTGICLGELSAEKLSKVTLDGEWLSGDKPSKEIKFHLTLYKNNPNCRAVVHLHSTYLTAFSCLENLDPTNAIKPFTPYVVMQVGTVPVIPYYSPGDHQIASDLVKLAPNHLAFILANHGAITTGKSLRDAVNKYEELEETAKLIFILNKHPIRYLTSTEINALQEK